MMVRRWILVLAFLICFELALTKSIEKNSRKKLSSLKKRPNKTLHKLTLDAFKDLPTDDLEFIKELDKQFKLHGNNVKIKVEADNTTSKTSKRTIDGELGYGNYHEDSRYHFSAPRYMIYPYSQHDIPPLHSGYSQGPSNRYLPAHPPIRHQLNYPEKTEVSVEPSYGYEIHQMPHNDNYKLVQQNYNEEAFVEPVIVLRLPGPSKYTAHIKELLQQYLEIRTAQYLRMLEANEAQKYHQHSHQQEIVEQPVYPVQYQQQHLQYSEADVEQNNHAGPVNYIPPIQEVYHHQKYKNKQKQNQQNHLRVVQQVQYQPEEQYQEQQYQEEPRQYDDDIVTNPGQSYQQQYIYVPKHQENIPESPNQYHSKPNSNHDGYEQVIYIQEVAMPEQNLALYKTAQENVQHQQNQDITEQHDNEPVISENSPRDTHTKVLFTNDDKEDHSMMYPLPSIQPFERHPPKSIPIHHSQAYKSNENYRQDIDLQYQGIQQPQSSDDSVVAITQRPFNYHAHNLRMRQRNNAKRDTEDNAAEKFRKFNKLIDKLKARELNES